jgi:hypothetical protein
MGEEEVEREEGTQEPEGEVEKKKVKEKPSVASRGIPSTEALYLPSHYSGELRAFQDKDEHALRFNWKLDEVMNFVFPKRYQAKYHEVALAFMSELNEKLEMTGKEVGAFISSHGISKATFYNRVLPRLKRVGMVKVERETIVARESKRKYRPMKLSLSKTFGNYLVKIGDSWTAIVDDARSRKK